MATTSTALGLLNLHPRSHSSQRSGEPAKFPRAQLLPQSAASSSSQGDYHPQKQQKQQQLKFPLLASSSNAASLSAALASAALPILLAPPDALATGGEFGILEGRSFALIHPVVMGGLFFYTLWAGYLGWQWRRIRTIQDDINELKKQVKPAQQPAAVGSASAAGETLPPAPPSPVETKIQELSEERKSLLKGNFRDRHFNAGSILLAFGVLESVGGGLNTWIRTGKLFPGPHLFSGAAITVLWAAAAALVPAMQKGNETARSLHIALNTINVLLFIWQIPTGIDIVFKVFEFTSWP